VPLIDEEVSARTYMELARLEKVLNDLGIDTNLVRKSEEFELHVLVAVFEDDEHGHERFINCTFMPLPEDEIEHVDLLQIFTSYPIRPTEEARAEALEIINGINPKLPFGSLAIDADGQIFYRYIFVKRRLEFIDDDAFGEMVLLFQFASNMFAEALGAVASGKMTAEEILSQLE
jgi:Putative bacterial sensory transduction regulator